MKRVVVIFTFVATVGMFAPSAQADSLVPSNPVFVQAQQGNAEAQFALGQKYRRGHGVTQSYDEAVGWYRKSAIQGYAPAEARLGGMYINGYGGLPKDETEGRKWLMRAANQGDSSAKLELAMMNNAVIRWERTLPAGGRDAVFIGGLLLFVAILAGLIFALLRAVSRTKRLVIRRR